MNTQSQTRQPGAAPVRKRLHRGPKANHAPPTGQALEKLLTRAVTELGACPLGAIRSDIEMAMDYLASREQFMTLLDQRAESLLHRRFAGPGDAAFEELMVDAMEVIELRLSEKIPATGASRRN